MPIWGEGNLLSQFTQAALCPGRLLTSERTSWSFPGSALVWPGNAAQMLYVGYRNPLCKYGSEPREGHSRVTSALAPLGSGIWNWDPTPPPHLNECHATHCSDSMLMRKASSPSDSSGPQCKPNGFSRSGFPLSVLCAHPLPALEPLGIQGRTPC